MSGGFGDRNRNELRLHLPAALFRAEDQNDIKTPPTSAVAITVSAARSPAVLI
jgi:hypothetical protein